MIIFYNKIKQILKQTILFTILRLVNTYKFKGNNVECILCGKRFKKFMSYGKPERSNAQCPFCFSLERERLLWHYLFYNTKLMNPEMRILHIAPENMFFLKLIKVKKENYFPADKLSLGNHYPKGTMDVDILDIPFNDNFFDLIICNHVLEHIENDSQAMKELYRVLNGNGIAVLLVPIDVNRKITFEDFSIKSPKLREKYFGRYDHVRVYGLDYQNRLSSAGFNVKVINYTLKFSKDEIFKYGFKEKEDLYICSKLKDEL